MRLSEFDSLTVRLSVTKKAAQALLDAIRRARAAESAYNEAAWGEGVERSTFASAAAEFEDAAKTLIIREDELRETLETA